MHRNLELKSQHSKVVEWESSEGDLSRTACQEQPGDPATASEVVSLGSRVRTPMPLRSHRFACCAQGEQKRSGTGAPWLRGRERSSSVSHSGCWYEDAQGKGSFPSAQPGWLTMCNKRICNAKTVEFLTVSSPVAAAGCEQPLLPSHLPSSGW